MNRARVFDPDVQVPLEGGHKLKYKQICSLNHCISQNQMVESSILTMGGGVYVCLLSGEMDTSRKAVQLR